MIYFKGYQTGKFHEGEIIQTKHDPICGQYHIIESPDFTFPIRRLAKEIYGRAEKENQEAALQTEDAVGDGVI